jgi:ribosome-associated protein
MGRKMQKGYFVRGTFVAEGSDLDQELKKELKGGEGPSRNDKKKAADALQQLGEGLLAVQQHRIDALGTDQAEHPLPENLIGAIAEARRLTNFEARRRQLQYVGKLMRRLDEGQVEALKRLL